MQNIYANIIQNTLFYATIPVLKYKISYPHFSTTCNASAAKHINEFYTLQSQQLTNYCRNDLYFQAVAAARYIPRNEPPFFSYEFQSVYEVTQNEGAVTSLYFDQYEYLGGAHGSTKRIAYTWDFCTGSLLHLEQFFPCNVNMREIIFLEIERQIEDILKDSPSTFFSDYRTLLRENFHSEQFYLMDNQIVVFYQQYDIAPYATGIPTFFIKYS